MKVGIIVLCRYNSSRLPGKILLEIEGKPVLTYILERLQQSAYSDGIVVATSDQTSDDPIEEYCARNNVAIFRGSLENVSDRFYQCAVQNKFDYAVRVNGDNLFTDPQLVDQAINLAIDQNLDFVSNVDQRTFPTGMSVEVVKTSFYKHILPQFNEYHQEHVASWIYEHLNQGSSQFIYNESLPSAHGLKLALDCEEDLNFVSLLLQKMDKPHTALGWQDIVKLATHE